MTGDSFPGTILIRNDNRTWLPCWCLPQSSTLQLVDLKCSGVRCWLHHPAADDRRRTPRERRPNAISDHTYTGWPRVRAKMFPYCSSSLLHGRVTAEALGWYEKYLLLSIWHRPDAAAMWKPRARVILLWRCCCAAHGEAECRENKRAGSSH